MARSSYESPLVTPGFLPFRYDAAEHPLPGSHKRLNKVQIIGQKSRMVKSRAEYMKIYRKKKREEKLKTGKVEPKKIAKSSTQRTRDFRARAANSILSQTRTADSTIALSNLVVSSATLRAPSLSFSPTPSTSTATACNTSPTEIHPHPAEVEQERLVGEDVEQTENVVHNSTVSQYHNYQKISTAHDELKTKFLDNNFGVVCNVCDRLCYESDMKSLPPCARELISAEFPDLNFETACICSTCHLALSKNKTPTLSKSHGFKYPSRPLHLPELDLISERLISPRLPFMTIGRLPHGNGQYGILGQVVNVPVFVYNKLPPEAVVCRECCFRLNEHCRNRNMAAARELGHTHADELLGRVEDMSDIKLLKPVTLL
ncbi:hypothetical protein evm_001329 [Chilo suppressalis]|nr:hypothetical protein evm_001329 [Chilo suppressalis]